MSGVFVSISNDGYPFENHLYFDLGGEHPVKHGLDLGNIMWGFQPKYLWLKIWLCFKIEDITCYY